jgi:hypothetical protein
LVSPTIEEVPIRQVVVDCSEGELALLILELDVRVRFAHQSRVPEVHEEPLVNHVVVGHNLVQVRSAVPENTLLRNLITPVNRKTSRSRTTIAHLIRPTQPILGLPEVQHSGSLLER